MAARQAALWGSVQCIICWEGLLNPAGRRLYVIHRLKHLKLLDFRKIKQKVSHLGARITLLRPRSVWRKESRSQCSSL